MNRERSFVRRAIEPVTLFNTALDDAYLILCRFYGCTYIVTLADVETRAEPPVQACLERCICGMLSDMFEYIILCELKYDVCSSSVMYVHKPMYT